MAKQDNFRSTQNQEAERRLWGFCYPHQILKDASMSLEEKRAILAAWASDVQAVESFPILRHLPGTPFPVTFSSIVDAFAEIDRQSCANDDDPPPRPGASRVQVEPPPVRTAA